MVVLSVFAAAAPSEKFFENNKRLPVVRFMFALNLVLLVGIGWFFTAGVWLLAWVLLWGKRLQCEEDQKKSQSV